MIKQPFRQTGLLLGCWLGLLVVVVGRQIDRLLARLLPPRLCLRLCMLRLSVTESTVRN